MDHEQNGSDHDALQDPSRGSEEVEGHDESDDNEVNSTPRTDQQDSERNPVNEETRAGAERDTVRRDRRTDRLHARWKKVYRLEKGILFKIDMAPGDIQPAFRLVVPERWQRTVTAELHRQICHLSVQRTYKIVSGRFYWENMLTGIKRFVGECPQCQISKTGPRKLVPPLLSLRKQGPWDTIGMDLYGPLPKTQYEF